MTRHEVVAHPNPIARFEAFAIRSIGSSWRTGRSERKSSARTLFELGLSHDAFLDQQRSKARQRSFVISRRQIMTRLHSFDCVTILVHVENAPPHRENIE